MLLHTCFELPTRVWRICCADKAHRLVYEIYSNVRFFLVEQPEIYSIEINSEVGLLFVRLVQNVLGNYLQGPIVYAANMNPFFSGAA